MTNPQEKQRLLFDQVFAIWLINEVGDPDTVNYLPVAIEKGFSSIAEWRLATALKLGLDSKIWFLENIDNPIEVLPKVKVGPYKGWSQFFDNKLETSFEEALEIPEFYEWCKQHDRIPKIAEHFPAPTTIILLRKENGDLLHIEGGHRMCALAYAKKSGIQLPDIQVNAAIADINNEELEILQKFLHQGTDK